MFTIQDYKEALLYDDSFKSLKIKPVTDEQGEFIFSSGRTAVVFKVKDLQTGKFKALKCFTMLHENALGRNQAIGRFLQDVQSPYLVNYQFLEEEIWVDDAFQPVVVMDWVEGNTLHFTLNSLCKQRKNKEILRLALMFDQMALWWLAQDFAHGDLKADNLIITPNNQLVAVDYEGFYVPALQGEHATELGTEDYQHPGRNAGFFCKDLDHVSILIISSALHALSIKPELWEQYNQGENLLLTWEDLKQAGKTEIWKQLLSLESSSVRNRLNLLMYALSSPPDEVAGIKQVLQLERQQIAEFEKIHALLPTYKPATLDITFMPQNNNVPILGGASVECILALPNGKILVGGQFSKMLALFDEQMNFEWEFWENLGDGFNGIGVFYLHLQPDGKILLGGDFEAFNDKPCNNIARLMPNGKWDSSFDIGFEFDWGVNTMLLQPDGKILVGGGFSSFDGKPYNGIARLLSNGKWDDSFYMGNGFDNSVNTIQLEPSGAIIVGGDFTSFDGKPCNRIVRLMPNGKWDTSFNIGNAFDNSVNTIHLMPDGKFLVGAEFKSFNGKKCNRIARLMPDGKWDSSFDTGNGFDKLVRTIQIQSDGKILVGGNFKSFNDKPSNHIARLLPNGKLDASFDVGNGFDEGVDTIHLLPDGKILVGGSFESFDSKPCSNIICIKPNGKRDGSFDMGDGFNGSAQAIHLQPDGKILVGGWFTSYHDIPCKSMARLMPNGDRDDSFDVGVGFDGWVESILLQVDGSILVAGSFVSFNGKPCNRIVRVLSDGKWDHSFDIGAGFDRNVNTIDIQPDGKILVGGWFWSFNGKSCKYIARLMPNGKWDDSFDIGVGFDSHVDTIHNQPDGKILVGGRFTSFNGKPCSHIARLLPNGKWDDNFEVRFGFDGWVKSIHLQPDAKILVGGYFTSFNGKACNYIARLLPNGQLDPEFDTSLGFDSFVYSLAITPDNKLLVGGSFMTYGNHVCNRIARLHL